MSTVNEKMKIIDEQLSKIAHTNLSKGGSKSKLEYNLDLKNGLKLHILKVLHETMNGKQPHSLYDVDFIVSKGNEVLVSDTIDVRELARKCNELNNKC